jgi:hypothetical protein
MEENSSAEKIPQLILTKGICGFSCKVHQHHNKTSLTSTALARTAQYKELFF